MTITFPTQADVARLSKVSRSTVAGILRDDPDDSAFAPSTRKRVMDAVKKLNYRPNSAAGALRSGRTHTIALTIPNFQAVRTPMQVHKLQGIGERASEFGYALTLSTYEERSNLHVTFDKLIREGRFDGVIFHGDIHHQQDERETVFAELAVPYVVLEKTSDTSTTVDFDSTKGGYLATQHLLKRGRKRIAFLGDGNIGIPYIKREQGYVNALREAGVDVDINLITPLILGDLAETGRAGVRQLINTGVDFDALFCITDKTAMGAMQALVAAGKSVGGAAGQVSVVGYDDDPMAKLAIPTLTTVFQDGLTMGRMAMDLLHEAIEVRAKNYKPEIKNEVIEPRLIVRASS